MENDMNVIKSLNADLRAAAADLAAAQSRIAALEAENERLSEELKLWPSRLTEIGELAWDWQGEWVAVDEVYAPNWTQGYKRILAEIEDHMRHREALQAKGAERWRAL